MNKYSKKIVTASWVSLLAALFVVLLTVVAAQLRPVRLWAGRRASEALSEAWGLPVSVGAIRYFPLSSVEVESVLISDSDSLPMVSLRRVVFDVSPSALFASQFRLSLVNVDSLDVVVRGNADGSLNLSALFASDSSEVSSSSSAPAFAVGVLRAADCSVSYEPYGSAPQRFRNIAIALDDVSFDGRSGGLTVSDVSFDVEEVDARVAMGGSVALRGDTLEVRDVRLSLGASFAKVDSLVLVRDSVGVRHAAVEIPTLWVAGSTATVLAGRSLPSVNVDLSLRLDDGIADVRRLRLTAASASSVTFDGIAHFVRPGCAEMGISWGRFAVRGRTTVADLQSLSGCAVADGAVGGDWPLYVDGTLLLDNGSGEASASVSLRSAFASGSVAASARSADRWRTLLFDARLQFDAMLASLTGGTLGHVAGGVSAHGNAEGVDVKSAMLSGELSRAEVAGVPLSNVSFNAASGPGRVGGMLTVDDKDVGFLLLVAEVDPGGVSPYASVAVKADSVRLGRFLPDVFSPDAWTAFRLRAEVTGRDVASATADLRMADFTLACGGRHLATDSLRASLGLDSLARRTFRLASDIASGTALGSFDFAGLADELKWQVLTAVPSLGQAGRPAVGEHVAEFDFSLWQSNTLAAMFVPSVTMADSLRVRGSIDSRTHTAWVNLRVDTLSAASVDAVALETAVASNNGSIGVGVRAGELTLPMVGDVANFKLFAEAEGDEVVADAGWATGDGVSEGGALNAEATLGCDADGAIAAMIGIDRSRLAIGGNVWDMDSCRFDVRPGRLGVSNFHVANGDHVVRAVGVASTRAEDTLRVSLSKIVLEDILKTDQQSKYSLEGDLYANADIGAVFGDLHMSSSARIERLKVNGDSLGRMDITTIWTPETNMLALGLDIVTGGYARAVATGYLDMAQSRMDLHFDIDSLSTGFLNFYLDNCIDSWRGTTSGKLRLHGPLDDLALDARLRMNDDNYFRVIQTNVTYHIDKNDSLVISPTGLDFLNIRFGDDRGGRAVFGGGIAHEMFSNLRYNLIFDVDKALLLKTTAMESPSYYGTVYGTGKMTITGVTSAIDILIDARTDRDSRFLVAPNAGSDVGMQDYILFKDPGKVVVSRTDKIGEGVAATLNLDITPDAELAVVVNPQTGNRLTGRGKGLVQVNIDRQGELTMFGDYEIESGMYNFSFENVINKQFAINRGGRIVWDGGPYDALVDITATYKVKASLYDLVQSGGDNASSELKRRVPVNCNIILSNKLTNPDIRFDIEIPSSQNFSQYAFDQYVSTPEEMNRQVFSLLMANRFYSTQESDGRSSQGSSYLGTTASELLSNQLSSLFSQNDRNIGVGVNYRPGDEVTNEEYEVSLSTQVLDNKILLSGNIGYGRDASGAASADEGSLIGDFDIEVKLNRQGSIRAKAYTHSNNDVLYETSPTTQGVGISFQEDFDSFRQLFRKYWDKIFHRRKKGEAEPGGDSAN